MLFVHVFLDKLLVEVQYEVVVVLCLAAANGHHQLLCFSTFIIMLNVALLAAQCDEKLPALLVDLGV